MENIGEAFYKAGILYFEMEKYEETISNWVQAYNMGYEKETILQNIYNCFIMPNEIEFRENYEHGSIGFTELPYYSCTLDFIPLREDMFFIFDREEKIFRGSIMLEKDPIKGENIEFNNILYTNTWDIREMLPDMKKNRRDVVYILLEDAEAKFVSFFKLPGFKERYLENVIAFKDMALMRTVFEEYEEFYLPKQIVTKEPEKYWNFIHEIHAKRIHDLSAERKNIFLSICIPSYNRGKIALENVRHLLDCPYDSEIEIIVSNNGSSEGIEEYYAIKNIGDARVRYHEFSENQGYAANVLKVCKMAKGKYAVLVSDEDWMVLENFDRYLNVMKSNPNAGSFAASVKGRVKFEKDAVKKSGLNTIAHMSEKSYITGLTYNTEFLRRMNAYEMLEKLSRKYGIDWNNEKEMLSRNEKRNLYLEILTQTCLLLMLCRYANMVEIEMDLWDAEVNCTDQKDRFVPFYRPESRMEMQNSFMEFCYQILELNKQDLIILFLAWCDRTHFLIKLSTEKFPDDMLKINSEWEIQEWIYQEQMKYLNAFPIPLAKEEYDLIQKKLSIAEIYNRNK